jgi:hypothetical protein
MSKPTPLATPWTALWAALFIAAAPLRTQTAALADSGSAAAAAAYHLTIEEAADFSKQIERALAAEGVRVAIVFQTGRARENMPDGLEYTHGAFWVYRDILGEDGATRRGYAVYNLYHGNGESLPRTESYLKQDWPLDFVRNSAVDDVGVIIPSPEMQRRILRVIDSPIYASLHNPTYSLIANPHESTYQNCNTFMLDVIAAAAWQTGDPDQIAANLRAYFEPQELEVGVLGRIFGPMADERLRTDDQHGAIKTATFHSMAAFMQEHGLLRESGVIEREGGA